VRTRDYDRPFKPTRGLITKKGIYALPPYIKSEVALVHVPFNSLRCNVKGQNIKQSIASIVDNVNNVTKDGFKNKEILGMQISLTSFS